MKLVLAILFLGLSQMFVYGQEEQKEITKEVEVHEENGEKTVTVKTTSNGLSKVETFQGEAAENYLSENGAQKMEGPRKEVKMINENGVKKLTVTTYNGEEVTEEVFEGEAADLKMAEIEAEAKENKQPVKLEQKTIIKQKTQSKN